MCGKAYENKTLELSCEGRPISAIRFASFGDSNGACGALAKGSCEGVNDAFSILQKVINEILLLALIYSIPKSN